MLRKAPPTESRRRNFPEKVDLEIPLPKGEKYGGLSGGGAYFRKTLESTEAEEGCALRVERSLFGRNRLYF